MPDRHLAQQAQLAPLLAGARLDHISMVVRDREQTIAHLSRLVTGPFYRLEYTNTALVYGKRSTYTLHMALAPLSPTLDLEIIQLADGSNAVHERFLEARGEGVQHIGYQVEDFEGSIDAFKKAGFEPILVKDGGTPVAIYMDTTAVGGTITELIRKGFKLNDPATWPK